MSAIRVCVVIPHYNHEQTICAAAQDVTNRGLHCIVVDDCSSAPAADALQTLETMEKVILLRRSENGGKGAAVLDGMRCALNAGFTHVLQIDADRQHEVNDIAKLLAAAAEQPDAIICTNPIYGDDAPKSRRYGRKITNFWIWVNTGSREIKDGMCGFRLYPLASVLAVLSRHHLNLRMAFDIESLVYCYWARLPFVWIDSPVRYAEDGVSHFNMFKDNLDISRMHAKLFFKGLLWRLRGR